MQLDAIPDRKLIRARGGSRRYLCVQIDAPDSPSGRARAPVNLAVVIDRSGSMQGEKIAKARTAAVQVATMLRAPDCLSLVVYDDVTDVLLPPTAVDATCRRTVERAVQKVAPRGPTNLCEGWLRGCEQVGSALTTEQVGRCLLLSDGLANRGITDHDEITAHAAALRDRGVATSTFGIGADFDEELMARIAEAGGGNFYYIESAVQIPDFVASEVSESCEVVARDVELVVRAPEGVSVLSPNEYPVVQAGDTWRVRIGHLVALQHLEPVIELRFPSGAPGVSSPVALTLEADGTPLGSDSVEIRFAYADDRENDAQTRDRTVDRRVADLYSARTRRAALRLNGEGQMEGARQALLACAQRVEGYAGDDPELRDVAGDLRRSAEEYAVRIDARSRKGMHYASMRMMKMRNVHGQSLRGQGRRSGPIVLLPLHSDTCALAERAVLDIQLPFAQLLGDISVSSALVPVWSDSDGEAGELTPDVESDIVRSAVACAGSAGVRIVPTRLHLHDSWFSHWHAAGSTAVSSLFGWHQTASVDPRAFMAHEIVLFGLLTLSAELELSSLMHAQSRGCLFDFCQLRSDIEIKLQVMDLCEPCEAKLKMLGIPLDALRQACEGVRTLAQPVESGTHPLR